MPILGYKELQRQLRSMGAAAGGRALRSAAMAATLPAMQLIRGSIPVRTEGGLKRTYKGRLVSEGFAARSVAREGWLSRDKRTVKISIGVKKEAFYVLNFHEFGTSTHARHPFMEPAFRRSIGPMSNRFRLALKQRIDKAARR